MLNQALTKYLGLMLLLNRSEGARILCCQPVPFDSHQTVLNLLADELARRGHELVVVTSMPRQNKMENITEIDMREFSYSTWEKGYDEATKHRTTYAFPDPLEFWNLLGVVTGPIHNRHFSHPQIQALIRDETQRFDLVIVDLAVQMGGLFSARFGAPLLVASATSATAELFGLIGAENNIFYYPDSISTRAQVWKLSFWEQLRFFYHILKVKLMEVESVPEGFVKKHFGEHIVSSGKLEPDVKMLFMNVNHFWDYNRPAPIGSVLYMGGIHLRPSKSLPQDLRTFVDKSKHGVVLVSLGSKLKSSALPARTLRVMVDVFSRLPYDFIWKWDADEMPNKPANVRIEKWIPQNDLLHNPSVKAFISHGGLLSTFEAIDARVPLIGLPVYGDQWVHTEQYEIHGIGRRLDIDRLNEEELRNAIVAVVEDKKYRDNIARLSRILSDRRESPQQAVSRLVHHLTTRGASHLRSPRADATFTEFYMLDLLAVATISAVIISVAIVFVVKRLVLLAVRTSSAISLTYLRP